MVKPYNEVTPFTSLRERAIINSEENNLSGNTNVDKSNKYEQNNDDMREENKKKGTLWPSSLEEFVNRSFTRSQKLLEEDQKEFNRQLQTLIERAVSSGTVWTNNWNEQRMPILDSPTSELQLDILSNKPVLKKAKKISGEASIFMPSAPRPKVKEAKETVKKATDHPESRVDHSGMVLQNPDASILNKGDYASNEKKRLRMERFQSPSADTPKHQYRTTSNRKDVIEGTCQDLEKQYLRLTSEPDPLKVRPQRVLEKSLDFVIDKYKKDPSAGYAYVNNQLKSIRQDITVQHIRNDFVLRVYETHGRIAIANNDLGEFNQCQSQLSYLYNLKKKYDRNLTNDFFFVEAEFICYRILYMIMTSNYPDIHRLKVELLTKSRKKENTMEKFITQAFDMYVYQMRGDYYNFFRIYEQFRDYQSLKLAFHLIRQNLVTKERIKALNVIVRAYRRIPLSYIQNLFKLTSDKEGDKDHLPSFLLQRNLQQFTVDGEEFDCIGARNLLKNTISDSSFRRIDIKGQK